MYGINPTNATGAYESKAKSTIKEKGQKVESNRKLHLVCQRKVVSVSQVKPNGV